jgi:hypothetical protein
MPGPRARRRGDHTPDELDALLLDLERTARALAGQLGADMANAWAARASAAGPGTPINVAIHDHLTGLFAYYRAWLSTARVLLGWSPRTINLSQQSGQRCPYCADRGEAGLTLKVNLDEGRIYCTNPDCRHPDTGQRYAWQIQLGATLAAMIAEQRVATIATQQLATASELAELLTYAGRPTKTQTVRSWASRGKLVAADHRGPHAQPLYSVPDACALAGLSLIAVLGYDPADLQLSDPGDQSDPAEATDTADTGPDQR